MEGLCGDLGTCQFVVRRKDPIDFSKKNVLINMGAFVV
jgi:hypothetical protein